MAHFKSWLKAARLRTLPLALSSIFLGIFLAAFRGNLNMVISSLCISTALFLQILSNFANDYGDARKGTDNENRVGPKRTVQSGEISASQMLKAMFITSLISCISGLFLVILGTEGIAWWKTFLFLALGLSCVLAAIKYTVGNSAYGYYGFGDLFVFIFFGLTGVVGTYFLQSKELFAGAWLMGASVGCFSVGVLNLNNIRDIENDRYSGKMTLPVRMGAKKAKIYHALLIAGGFLFALCFVLMYFTSFWMLLGFVSLPLFLKDIKEIFQTKEACLLDPYLKKLSISTLFFVFLFGLGLLLSL